MSYYVFASPTAGSPIDYATPIAATASPGLVTPPGAISGPGAWCFGARAYDGFGDAGFGGTGWGGLGQPYGSAGFGSTGFGSGEEQNLDCAVKIVIDSNGNDVTDRPLPPYGLTARPTAAAGVRAEWWYPATIGPAAPTGFYVYITAGGSVDYSAIAATVGYDSGISGGFAANLTGLTSGTTYSIGVRARNQCGAEQNTAAVSVTADSAGPAAVDSLVGAAVV